MRCAAIILGQLPAAVWFDMDYSELDGVFEAYTAINGGSSDDKPGAVDKLNDLDRYLIAQERERLTKAA